MEAIDRVLDYIEQNLCAELSLEELAERAGYSVYHFCRIFASQAGMPVREYVQSRRLARAIGAIAQGQPAVNVALYYGYDTYAGFYKAFVRAMGCAPTQYLRIHEGDPPLTRKWREYAMPKKEDLRDLLVHWPVNARSPVTPMLIMGGEQQSDTSFAVGDQWVMKVYSDVKTLERVVALAVALDAQGFCAALPLQTKSGQDSLRCGDVAVLLAKRVPGLPLPIDRYYGSDGFAHASEAGAAIARLHKALAALPQECARGTSDMYRTCTDWALPVVRKQDQQWNMGLGEAFFEEYLQGFGALIDALPRQMIHRDPNPSNILFEDDRVSGFIDFDLCERNVRLFDPCYCATGILSESLRDPERYARWPSLLGAVLSGYDQVLPLTPEEKRAVFYVVISIQMICGAYCAGFEDAAMQKLFATERHMLDYMAKHRSEIEAAIR